MPPEKALTTSTICIHYARHVSLWPDKTSTLISPQHPSYRCGARSSTYCIHERRHKHCIFIMIIYVIYVSQFAPKSHTFPSHFMTRDQTPNHQLTLFRNTLYHKTLWSPGEEPTSCFGSTMANQGRHFRTTSVPIARLLLTSNIHFRVT